jgi:hypothetical protein
MGADGVLEVDGEGAEEPRQDYVVNPALVGVIEGRSIEGDMVIEGVALEHQQHEVTPTRVLGECGVEDDGHPRLDVLDANNLSVDISDGGNLEHVGCRACLPRCNH